MQFLKKGENKEIVLPSSNKITLVSGYKQKNKPELQIDFMAICLNDQGKPINDPQDFFFYGTGLFEKIPYGQGYKNHNGSLEMLPFDTSTNNKEQKIVIDFSKISPETDKIVFLQTIFNAEKLKLNFGNVSDSYFRLENQEDLNNSICFEPKDILSNVLCLLAVEIYRYKGVFKVRALGQGYSKNIKEVLKEHHFSIK